MKVSERIARLVPNDPRVAFALVIIGALVALGARAFSWPGFATHDTLFITQEALRGSYTSYHPLLNALLIRGLAVPFDSFAVYTSVQILLCVVLFVRGASLVAQLLRKPAWLLVGVVAWALMPSTSLYLGMIWKDVVAAYCIFYLAALCMHVRQHGALPGRADAVLFGLGLFLLVGMRHGMAFNLVLVPLAIGVGRIWRAKAFRYAYLAVLGGLFCVALVGASPLVKNDEAHLLKLKIAAVSQPFLGMVVNRSGYTTDNGQLDRELADHVFGPDFRDKYRPDYVMTDVILTDAVELEAAYHDILKRTARLCLLNVSQCGSDRVQMMLATLQPSTEFGGMKFYDLGLFENCAGTFGMDPDKCDVLARFESLERPEVLAGVQRSVVEKLVDRRGVVPNLVVWNLLPFLVLLLGALVLLRAGHPVWVASLMVLLQIPLALATSMANDFRYYYFLAPFGYILFGLVAARLFGGRDLFIPGLQKAGPRVAVSVKPPQGAAS